METFVGGSGLDDGWPVQSMAAGSASSGVRGGHRPAMLTRIKERRP
jgi:hypothetical protein